MLKKVLVIAVTLSASLAWADFEEGKNAVSADLGFTRGGMAIGFEFEHGYDRTYGLGAYFRMDPDENDPATDGYTTIGAFIRPHFNRANWDLFVSPGFGMVFFEPGNPNADEETLLGPSLQIGLFYEFSTQMAFGFDVFEMWSWFGEEDYRGQFTENTFSAKFRFIF